MEILSQAGIMALMSMMVALGPMFMGATYALKPSEAKLALMRPISLAGLFSGLTGTCVGSINMLMWVTKQSGPINYPAMLAGGAESLVTLALAFGCLTIGWLFVALGMRRQSVVVKEI